MVVGLLTRTTSRVAKSTSRQVARRNVTTEPKKYNLPDFDDTTADPYKVKCHLCNFKKLVTKFFVLLKFDIHRLFW